MLKVKDLYTQEELSTSRDLLTDIILELNTQGKIVTLEKVIDKLDKLIK